MALGDRRRDLVLARPVQLRWPPRPRPLTAGCSFEADLDDARVSELVKVESGDGAVNAERRGSVVATRPALGRGEQSVEVTAHRLVERGDAGDALLER